MNALKFLSIAAALALATTANAQSNKPQQAAAPGTNTATLAPSAPVTCVAKGYWSGGGSSIVLRKLDRINHTVDVEYIDNLGINFTPPGFKAMWTFQNGILRYDRFNKVRYTLVVGSSDLSGSYQNFQAPGMSKPQVIFLCDGPTSRIIVP